MAFSWSDRSQPDHCSLERSLPDNAAITNALNTCIVGHERLWAVVRYNADNNPWYAPSLAQNFLIGEPPGLSRRNEEHHAPPHRFLCERRSP